MIYLFIIAAILLIGAEYLYYSYDKNVIKPVDREQSLKDNWTEFLTLEL